MNVLAKEVYRIIAELINEAAVEIVKALKNRPNVSEFKLAEELDQEINVTRNLLYKLYDLNLVSFTRKKDQKKGWYIHYWTFNKKEVRFLILKYLKNKVDKLTERLEREKTAQFFVCKSRCIRLTFEQATDFSFKCPECGELLYSEDNTKKIDELEGELKTYKKQLKDFFPQ